MSCVDALLGFLSEDFFVDIDTDLDGQQIILNDPGLKDLSTLHAVHDDQLLQQAQAQPINVPQQQQPYVPSNSYCNLQLADVDMISPFMPAAANPPGAPHSMILQQIPSTESPEPRDMFAAVGDYLGFMEQRSGSLPSTASATSQSELHVDATAPAVHQPVQIEYPMFDTSAAAAMSAAARGAALTTTGAAAPAATPTESENLLAMQIADALTAAVANGQPPIKRICIRPSGVWDPGCLSAGTSSGLTSAKAAPHQPPTAGMHLHVDQQQQLGSFLQQCATDQPMQQQQQRQRHQQQQMGPFLQQLAIDQPMQQKQQCQGGFDIMKSQQCASQQSTRGTPTWGAPPSQRLLQECRTAAAATAPGSSWRHHPSAQPAAAPAAAADSLEQIFLQLQAAATSSGSGRPDRSRKGMLARMEQRWQQRIARCKEALAAAQNAGNGAL